MAGPPTTLPFLELLGLHHYGPIVNVDESKPPYANTRRLITSLDVGGDAEKPTVSSHPASQPQESQWHARHEPVCASSSRIP